jgi:outer membrane protein OmpA-like peptidoglycan-associated protein
MISRLFTIAIFIVAGPPALAQTRPDCPPPCTAGASSGAMEERLNLDTGSLIRKQALERAKREGAAAEPFANGGGIIPFALDTFNPGKAARAKLDPLIAWLKAHPERKVRIDGHADDPGTDEYNLALGDKRANSVLTYMVGRGIEPSRLSTISFGRSRPLFQGAGAKQNSRVEIIPGQ